jgi:hypothetical protein
MTAGEQRMGTLVCCIVVGALLVLGGCDCLRGLLCGPLLGLPTTTDKDNLQLMGEAEQIVWAEYPNAVLIEVHGHPSSGSATVAEDVDEWVFIFPEEVSGPTPPGTVTLDYASGQFGQPVYVPDVWVGTVYESLPRQISLAQAIKYMRDAGHVASFTSVVLRKPLIWPEPEEAFYAFTMPGRFVLVGALTGKVWTEIPQ